MEHLPSITRREALRQTFFFSAALLANLLPKLDAAPSAAAGTRHFLTLGDFGRINDPQQSQQRVADAMLGYVEKLGVTPDALFLLGDNFYGAFEGGVNCPRWQGGFEQMYPSSAFPGPCWAMLGNHDYDEGSGLKLAAQLSYASAHPGTRWTMPAKWYRVDWPRENPLFTCLVLDSNYHNHYLYLSAEERAKQLAWMKTELAKPRVAPWLICAGHHPLFSNGPHGDTKALIEDWGPLFQQHGVSFYFCGHDHDLQHLEFEGLKTSFVVSGGGGAAITDLKVPDRGPFSLKTLGFTHLEVTPEKFIVRHIDGNQHVLHAFSRTAAGAVDILD